MAQGSKRAGPYQQQDDQNSAEDAPNNGECEVDVHVFLRRVWRREVGGPVILVLIFIVGVGVPQPGHEPRA